MTVCIAAIYNENTTILGASDRMVTGGYGDITFEPGVSKILQLTNSIAVLTAGDQSIQIQVFQKVAKIIEARIVTDPSKWIELSDATEIYSKCFYELRNKLLENSVLSPYNLTLESFITQQKVMDREFIDMLNNKIGSYLRNFDGIETIITGIDDFGPHIYVVSNGEISCNDKSGFASIGIGSNLANSHFMFSSYSPRVIESKALLTIHQAKKKAEASPGVGKATDMCVIGPLKGTFNTLTMPPLLKDVVKDLDKFYVYYKKKIEKIDKITETKIRDYLNQLAFVTPPKQEASPSSSISPSAPVSPSPSPAPLSTSPTHHPIP